uniref:mucin-19 isoform X1 n=1 Tax=Anopheles coluzzii TaxID=1518534 RepID=UPI0020FF9D43|nr:mucin-19 isoform X1 [Anopheles coluzzii]
MMQLLLFLSSLAGDRTGNAHNIVASARTLPADPFISLLYILTRAHDSQAPDVTEKTQPTCLPLSYVLRFVTDESRRDGGGVASPMAAAAAATSTNSPDKAQPAAVAGGNGLRLSGSGQQTLPPPSSINQKSAASDHHGTAGTNGGAAANLHGIAATNHLGAVGTNGTSGSSAPANGGGGATPNGIADQQQQNGLGGAVAAGAGGLEPGKPAHLNQQTVGTTDLKRKIAIKHHSYSISAANRSITPTGSEMDDDEMMVSESEDSNDSWTTEEFSSEFIMRYGSRRHSASGGGSGINSTNEKPFACPVPGCKKRYKNVNGIKYHSKNGHKKDGNRVRKAFKCYCGKSYKTAQRLKNHNVVVHAAGGQNGGSPIDGPSVPVTTVPLASPAGGGGGLSSPAALISPPIKSPSLTNGGQSAAGPNATLPSSGSSIVTAAAAAIASSQIGTNATTTNTSATCTTSPSTLTITQVTTHKVPRALVLAANGTGTGSAVAGSTGTTVTVGNSPNALPVVSGASPPAVGFPVSPTTITSAGVSPVSIKYDNLGILTPATSPKLIAASLCGQEGGGNQPQPAPPPPPPTVVTTATMPAGSNNTTTVLGGISLKGSGTAATVNGELVGNGNVGTIALVVSASSATVANGSEAKLLTGGGGGTGPTVKSAVLSASVTAGQLFAEET